MVSITHSMDLNLNKLPEIVKEREAWHAAVHGVTELNTTQQLNNIKIFNDSQITFLEGISLRKHPMVKQFGGHWLVVIVVQSLSCVQLFVTPWIAALQPSIPFIISQSFLKLRSIVSVMPSNHLILCSPHLLLPSIYPSIRIFSDESALCIRWPKYWSFSFSISPSNEYLGLISTLA